MLLRILTFKNDENNFSYLIFPFYFICHIGDLCLLLYNSFVYQKKERKDNNNIPLRKP